MNIPNEYYVKTVTPGVMVDIIHSDLGLERDPLTNDCQVIAIVGKRYRYIIAQTRGDGPVSSCHCERVLQELTQIKRRIKRNETLDQQADLEIQAALKEPVEFWMDSDQHIITYHISRQGSYVGADIHVSKYACTLDTRDGIIDSFREPYGVISGDMRILLEEFYNDLYEEDNGPETADSVV